jgi:dihydroflavonol-4-reductase
MIFVTGGTGLVGSHLLYDLVKKGLSVRALLRSGSSTEEVKKIFSFYSENADELFSKITWIEGDLLDVCSLTEGMKDVTQVYHCAALISLDPKDGEKMISVNVTGTANVVNAAIEMKIRKLCYVSSVATLGTAKGKYITEETAWNEEANFSAYTISKYLSENEVWRAAEEGLPVVIVNPTIILGPGSLHRSSGLFFKKAIEGISWYSKGGMGYVDVRDVTQAMTMLMQGEVSNQKFIVSSENLSFRKFFELLCLVMRKPIPTKRAGRLILEFAWRADKFRNRISGRPHCFTRQMARHASETLAFSNEGIKSVLSINFIPVIDCLKNASSYFLSGDFEEK